MENNAKEYELLRQEILSGLNTIKNYRAILYTSVATIFAFSFTQTEPLIFLVPAIVIIPIYLMSMNQTSSILRIGAYLKVFLEGEDFFWESRLLKYDNMFVSKNPSIDPYVFTSVCCTVLCLARLDYSRYLTSGFWIRILMSLIFLLCCVIILRVKRIDYKQEKMNYLRKWEEIRKAELDNIQN